jgi:hypothetical protein
MGQQKESYHRSTAKSAPIGQKPIRSHNTRQTTSGALRGMGLASLVLAAADERLGWK